jgi:ribonuclease VapC
MIVDSSAVIAILADEPESDHFSRIIAAAPAARLGGVNYVESSVVIGGRWGELGEARFDQLLQRLRIQVEPISSPVVEGARLAYRLYGKGRHPARLNLGDCFAYALSKHAGEPLLFKGDDFRKTDVIAAL